MPIGQPLESCLVTPVAESQDAKGRICLLSLHRIPGESVQTEAYVRSIVDRFENEGWHVESRNLNLEFDSSATAPIHPTYRSALIDQFIPKLDQDVLLIVDELFELDPDWFLNAVEILAKNDADLVVASRNSRDWFGKIAAIGLERLTGCQAVNASALVVRTQAIRDRHAAVKPAGRWLSLEFQLRVPQERSTVLASHNHQKPRKSTDSRFGRTELSFIKSFIDHKFGSFSRLVQFCTVGFSGMLVDLTSYAGFQTVFRNSALSQRTLPVVKSSADLALAGFLAIWMAITWNFLLNRRLTFNDARGNSTIFKQYGTYVLSNALALMVSFMLRLWLPANFAFFDEHKLVAAVVGIVIATGISFNMTRYFVFASSSRSAK
jgi:dolichol-phosphate mannosyltransferase